MWKNIFLFYTLFFYFFFYFFLFSICINLLVWNFFPFLHYKLRLFGFVFLDDNGDVKLNDSVKDLFWDWNFELRRNDFHWNQEIEDDFLFVVWEKNVSWRDPKFFSFVIVNKFCKNSTSLFHFENHFFGSFVWNLQFLNEKKNWKIKKSKNFSKK